MRTMFLLAAALCSFAVQDPTKDASMLRQAQQLAVPVANHQRLQRLVGEWKVAVESIVAGGAPAVSQGTVVGKSMLGGRYVVLNYRLPLAGRDVEAVQILGFDTLHQIYTSSWRDDASTWSVEASGGEDKKATDVLQLRGALTDARDPEGRAFRIEFDLTKPDAVAVRLFDTIGGKEVRVQTQAWTR